MSVIGQEFQASSKVKSDVSRTKYRSPNKKSPRHKTTRDCPRVTLRLSLYDYECLKQLADGMALATYIRAIVLNEKLPRRKLRSATSVADKQAVAQILGLLGQSRIANNLNQLAYHANIGALAMEEETEAQISEHMII